MTKLVVLATQSSTHFIFHLYKLTTFMRQNLDLYQYRCDISSFTLSKSHKKIIKKLNKFLADGHRDDETVISGNQNIEQHASMDGNNSCVEAHRSENEFDVDKAKDIVMQTMKYKPTHTEMTQKNAVDVPSCSETSDIRRPNETENMTTNNTSGKSNVTGADASKPLRKKAKLMRMERKAQKLASTNQLLDNVPKKEPKNVQKSLSMLLNEVQDNSRHKLEVLEAFVIAYNLQCLLMKTPHTFQVKLLPSDESNKCVEVLKLYRKYQMAVHNDPLDKLTESSFERFLVNSPLKVITFHCLY